MNNYDTKQAMIDALRPAIAEEFEVEEADLALDARIKETLDLDSLSLVDLVAIIEQCTGIKPTGTDIKDILTFGALYDYIWGRCNG